MSEAQQIISIDVECPWCGAEPGSPCTEGDGQGGVKVVSAFGAHLARTKEVRVGRS